LKPERKHINIPKKIMALHVEAYTPWQAAKLLPQILNAVKIADGLNN
jgi:hypothetical protein